MKTFDRDPATGQVMVMEMHPLYPDVEARPARTFEAVGLKMRGFLGDCLDTVRLVLMPQDETE